MRIAAIQHRLRETGEADALALADAARRAAAVGADVVVLPEVPSLADPCGPERATLFAALEGVSGALLLPSSGPGAQFSAAVGDPPPAAEELGRLALISGDACIDAEQLQALAEHQPFSAVLWPRSENDLQAEAALELAIGLSESLAGLVVIAECTGAELGESGHGGSVIVLLGDVMAEALGDGDDVLTADVPSPVPEPAPREALPKIPLILTQRLAHHRGQPVPHDYLADV